MQRQEGTIKWVRLMAPLAPLLWLGASHVFTQQPSTRQRPPIIDMHLHAFSWDHQGNPPPPNPLTGKVPSARTDKEAMEASLAELRRYNVVRAVIGGRPEHVSRWQAADPERIIGGTMLPLPDVDVLRREFLAGRLACWLNWRCSTRVYPQRPSDGTLLGVGRGVGYPGRPP